MADDPNRPDSSDPVRITTREDFAYHLTLVRQRAGLTVRDVAKATGVQASTVGGYFGGAHLPPIKPADLLPRILRACGVTNPAQVEQWQAALARVRRAPGKRPSDAPVPYRGLESFQPEHVDWFYGREDLTHLLLERLAARSTAGAGLLVVVGPSGSGKSSLLRAGLIPAWRRSTTVLPGSHSWPYVLFTPGTRPLQNLAEQLGKLTGLDAEDVAADLRSDPGRCTHLARQAAALHLKAQPAHSGEQATACGNGPADGEADGDRDSRRLLMVIDQFEETFTACTDDAERAAFLATLTAATAVPGVYGTGVAEQPAESGPAVLAVLGLRADFYTSILRDADLARAAQDGQVVVGPMTESDLRRAIEEPAHKAHTDIQDGLVELLLRDFAPASSHALTTAHEAGALPLLSHALLATWERGHRRRLTVADYRSIGAIHGAVARSADEVYETLTGDERTLARELFVRLVRVSEDGADTRRRISQTDLVTGVSAARSASLARVLDRYVERRLITVDADTIEISHEALIQAWPRLRTWIDTDRAGILIGQQLTDAALGWAREHRDPAALYRGTRLIAARDWIGSGHRGHLTPLAAEFLDASARHERRRTRRLYRTIAALMALLVVAGLASAVAFQQRAAATHERNLAISRLVATRADRLRDSDVSLAAQLSLAAYKIAPTSEARASLLDASATYSAARALGGPGVMQSVAYSPDRRVLAAGGADKTVRLWDVSSPEKPRLLGRPLPGAADTIYSVAFSPDGHTLAAGSGDHNIYLWDVSNPHQPIPLGPPLAGPTALVYSVAFSPDGHTLAAGSGDNTIHLWDVSDPRRPATLDPALTGPTSYVQSVAFSPDGNLLAAGSDDHTVRLWNIHDPRRPVPLGAPLIASTKRIFSVTFSPDGHTLAAGSLDKNVYLWNVTDPARPTTLNPPISGATSWVNAVAFSPDGQTLALASSDNTARLWSLPARRFTATLPHPGPVTSLAFGRDNRTLATSAADGVARLWALPGPVLTGQTDVINGVAFSPDGRTLAVAGGQTQLWSVADRTEVSPPLANPTQFSGTVAFTPDGHTLAVGARDGTVQLWNVTNPAQPQPAGTPIKAHSLLVESLAFSPDGRTLATGSDDNTVRLWDVTHPAQPQALKTLSGFRAYVYSVAFSPSGRTLAAGSIDKTVRLWDVTNPRQPAPVGQPLTGPDHYVLAVAFNPDGRILAVGSADKTVRLYDLANPRRPVPLGQPLSGPTNYVYSLAFSPDGRSLAAGDTDGTVWLWDVRHADRPTALATLTVPSGSVYSVAYNPDGHTLAAGGADMKAWLWDTDPERVIAQVCAAVGDPLTREEWAQYVPGLPYQRPCP